MKFVIPLLLAMLIICPSYAAELFGTVDAITGNGTLSDASGNSGNIVQDQQIFEGATINTPADTEIHITTADGGLVAIRPNTIFKVDEYKADGEDSDKVAMSLLKGGLRSITGWIGKHNPGAYRLSTPSAVIGIRGTDHEVTVVEETSDDEAGTYETVNEGATVISSKHGETEVLPGKFAFASRTRAEAPSILTKNPNFWARRKLILEHRILKRKLFLKDKMEHMRENRIKHLLGLRAKKGDHGLQKILSNESHDKSTDARLTREQRREARQKKKED